jgi:predicted GTPase
MSDLQCKAILHGLSTLDATLSSPIGTAQLDALAHVDVTANKAVLERLHKSLQQYLERQGTLLYVGCVGHFSAGKSSTINSLAALGGTSAIRATGLHPTDTMVTLITHDETAQSLLSTASDARLTIRVLTAPRDFLRHIVLIDTPGTGDPQLVEDMAKDLLPLCDIVLFFFASTSPLDKTDLPLLRELRGRLPFLPMLFIVTRADEFRVDDTIPITENNFAHAAATEFLAETISRLSHAVDQSPHPDQFYLVDNRAQFGIDLLREHLVARADPGNISARLDMHWHKVGYFHKRATQLRDFFVSVVDRKLEQASTVVVTAERNIQRYNDSVYISNNSLTHSWGERLAEVAKVRLDESAAAPTPPDIPVHLSRFPPIASAASSLAERLNLAADFAAVRLLDEARDVAFGQLERALETARARFDGTAFDALVSSSHSVYLPSIAWDFSELAAAPGVDLNKDCSDYRGAVRRELNLVASTIETRLRDLNSLIVTQPALGHCERIVAAAKLSLNRDLDSYFQNVHVYRAGVFALETREMISRLGISKDLQRLEAEFTEDDTRSFYTAADEQLFPAFAEISTGVAAKFRELSAEVRQAEASADGRLSMPPDLDVHPEIARVSAGALTRLSDPLSLQVRQFVDKLNTDLEKTIASCLQECRDQLRVETERRTRWYRNCVLISLILGLVGYAGYVYREFDAGTSVRSVLVWGLVVEFGAALIAWLWARFSDNFPTSKAAIHDQCRAKMGAQLKGVITSTLRRDVFMRFDPAGLAKLLREAYAGLPTIFLSDQWGSDAVASHAALKNRALAYGVVRVKYVAVVNEITTACSSFFADASGNLVKLKTISSDVKARAIEPSFVLLAEARKALTQIRHELSAIVFTPE